jgi:phospholipase C
MSQGVVPPPRRRAGSLPFPGTKPGTPNDAMPFDHLIVVMMENHSFDNLLGALSRDNPDVDGLTFAPPEKVNSNPGTAGIPGPVRSFPFQTTAQLKNISQSWKATHEQINGGDMNGFVRQSGATEAMGYYPKEILPFAYSLASKFTVANRWFCSMPGPTYPNRRFLLAGTAYGATVTETDTLLDPPPLHGTIFDQLSQHNINWCNYFTDIPLTAVIPSIIVNHPRHLAHIDKFFHDCQAGTLPAVSFVDPALGALSEIGSKLSSLPSLAKDILKIAGADFASAAPGETQEDPQDMYWGEAWAHRLVESVLQSPSWKSTLLIYTYDEHGGYYDHVPPPRAIPPDSIAPVLSAGDPPGAYDMYGPRVPAVVVSPYSKPGGVSDLIYDHTSVLATIEAKWNLPALTLRDANANHVMDFLDLRQMACGTPPVINAPTKPPGLAAAGSTGG